MPARKLGAEMGFLNGSSCSSKTLLENFTFLLSILTSIILIFYRHSIEMGLHAHSRLAIAQTVAYVPIVPLAIFITMRNRSHPPVMAWYPFILFSMSQNSPKINSSELQILTIVIVRLAGGPVVLALENDTTSLGLIIAALILLNVGLIPLLVTTFGIIRLM